MVDVGNSSFDDDWRSRQARIQASIRRTQEAQRKSREIDLGLPLMPTLIEVAGLLCDQDAPPPTVQELCWLKDNLVMHQQSVERLIGLIEMLLERSDTSASQ